MMGGFLSAAVPGIAIAAGVTGVPDGALPPGRPMLVAMKDVTCVQEANSRKWACDASCQSVWETDCTGACEGDAPWETAGACIALCQRSANSCYRDCIDSHLAEVDGCPNR